MRRAVLVLATVVGFLLVGTPASAFAHDRVTNPYLHAAMDGLVVGTAIALVLLCVRYVRRNVPAAVPPAARETAVSRTAPSTAPPR